MKNYNKLLAMIASSAMVAASLVPAQAADVQTKVCTVTAVQESTYSVNIPQSVVLKGTDGTYTVTAKGSIGGNQKVKIVPQDAVEDREGINFLMSQAGLDDIVATITQETTEFAAAGGVNTEEGQSAEGTIHMDSISAGKWQGQFTFEISFVAE